MVTKLPSRLTSEQFFWLRLLVWALRTNNIHRLDRFLMVSKREDYLPLPAEPIVNINEVMGVYRCGNGRLELIGSCLGGTIVEQFRHSMVHSLATPAINIFCVRFGWSKEATEQALIRTLDYLHGTEHSSDHSVSQPEA